MPKSKKFLDLSQELMPPAHLKAQWGDFSEDLNYSDLQKHELAVY